MCVIYRLCATTVLLAAITIPAEATPILFEIDLVNNLATGLEREGRGVIEWDPMTGVMTQFDWDFLEGDQPGGKGNFLFEPWLTSAFGGGTNGAALWELITGEDVFPDPLTMHIALASDGAFSSNGFPNYRTEFFPGGEFKFFDFDFNSGQEMLVGEGTINLRDVPEPSALALVVVGLLSLGMIGRRRRRR